MRKFLAINNYYAEGSDDYVEMTTDYAEISKKIITKSFPWLFQTYKIHVNVLPGI